MSTAPSFEAIADALRSASSTLREARVPFVLGGSFAAWARGGPQPYNDLDLMVKPEDAEHALRELGAAGMRTERPPEEWLFKAWHGEVMIDLIFEPAGLEMSDEVLARADTLAVFAVATPVMALEDMLQTKLMALDEHSLDYSALVRITRSVREQIDWRGLEARTSASPYAQAFFTLARGLRIAPSDHADARGHGARVRVMHSS
jgi:putative nucleotidyltransferase-like protein